MLGFLSKENWFLVFQKDWQPRHRDLLVRETILSTVGWLSQGVLAPWFHKYTMADTCHQEIAHSSLTILRGSFQVFQKITTKHLFFVTPFSPNSPHLFLSTVFSSHSDQPGLLWFWPSDCLTVCCGCWMCWPTLLRFCRGTAHFRDFDVLLLLLVSLSSMHVVEFRLFPLNSMSHWSSYCKSWSVRM